MTADGTAYPTAPTAPTAPITSAATPAERPKPARAARTKAFTGGVALGVTAGLALGLAGAGAVAGAAAPPDSPGDVSPDNSQVLSRDSAGGQMPWGDDRSQTSGDDAGSDVYDGGPGAQGRFGGFRGPQGRPLPGGAASQATPGGAQPMAPGYSHSRGGAS